MRKPSVLMKNDTAVPAGKDIHVKLNMASELQKHKAHQKSISDCPSTLHWIMYLQNYNQ